MKTATVSLLREWSPDRIAAQCSASYRAYHRVLRARHLSWAAAAPQRWTDREPFVAESLDAALPAGWGPRLEALLPATVRHRHYLSAGSSQVLALAVLGPAAKRNDGLPWLVGADGLFPSIGKPVLWGFEYKVGFALLNEKPRMTGVDFVASGPLGVIAVEAKFMEKGMGGCDCPGRAEGRCGSVSLTVPIGTSRATSSSLKDRHQEGHANLASRTRRCETSQRRSSWRGCGPSRRSGSCMTSGIPTSLARVSGRDGRMY